MLNKHSRKATTIGKRMLHASSIQPQNGFQVSHQKKIILSDIIDFTRELSFLLNAGISITQALDIISSNHEKVALKKLIVSIKIEIESGHLLGNVLQKHASHFSALYVQLILIGERSGSLDSQLNHATDYLEKKMQAKNKLKKALTYPFVVIFVTCLVISGLLLFVIPQFETLFQRFHSELPLFTRLIIQASHYFKYVLLCFFIFSMLSMVIYHQLKKNNLRFSFLIDQFFLKMPILGTTLRNHFIANICHLLAVTYQAGIPFPDALRLLSNSIQNQIYANALLQAQVDIQRGIPLPAALENTRVFPKRVPQLLYIGEHSGELLNMLKKMSLYYEQQMDQTLDRINKLLEPILMILLGLVIGSLIIGMYLPIFQIGRLF